MHRYWSSRKRQALEWSDSGSTPEACAAHARAAWHLAALETWCRSRLSAADGELADRK